MVKDNEVKLELLKNHLKEYRDLFGDKIIGYECIDFCDSRNDLLDLLDEHSEHIESMCLDARNSISNFKRKVIGLNENLNK